MSPWAGRWQGYMTVTIPKYDIMRALGIPLKFTAFERLAGRLIAAYVVWKAITR